MENIGAVNPACAHADGKNLVATDKLMTEPGNS